MAKRKAPDGTHEAGGESRRARAKSADRLGIGGNGGPSDAALKAAKRLEAVAARTIEAAEKQIAQPRLMNTARRARLGGGVVDRAHQDVADAKTALKIAEALRNGEAGPLSNVKSLADIRELRGLAREAEYATDRKLNRSYKQGGHGLKVEDVSNLGSAKGYVRLDRRDVAAMKEALAGKKGLAADFRTLERYSERATAGGRTNFETSDAEVFKAIRNVANAIKKADALKVQYPHQAKSLKYSAGRYLDAARDFDRAKGVAGVDAEARQAVLRAFMDVRAGKTKADPIRAAEQAVMLGPKLPGFFPTPDPLAKRMAELAEIKAGMAVLEPSAGTGRLADAAKALGASVDTVEMQSSLRSILEQKGHKVVDHDFTSMTAEPKYDRVLMNPPFEKGQDMAHVRQAYEMLKPGGKMVAIMGEGGFFRSDKQASAFRDWLSSVGGSSEKLPEGTFKESNTGVNTRLVTISKPAAVAEASLKATAANAAGVNPGWSDAARAASAEVRAANAKPSIQSAVERALAASAAKSSAPSTLVKPQTGSNAPNPVGPVEKVTRAAETPAPKPVTRDTFMTSATVEPHPKGGHLVKGPGLPEAGLHTTSTGTPTAAKAVAYSKVRAGTAKAVGLLAPVGIAAGMMIAANQAKAEGTSQVKAAAKAGAEGAGTMAGFMAAHAGATYALMKAGLKATAAIPGANALMIAGGAIHGAATAKPGERLAGAARGAWDMSLPGMVVNTGVAAHEAIKGRAAPAASVVTVSASVSTSQNGFAAANQAFSAMQKAKQADGPVLRGTQNPNNLAAIIESRTNRAVAAGAAR